MHDYSMKQSLMAEGDAYPQVRSSAGVVPVEVKAGNNKSKSLDRILKREDIYCGYKLIDGNTGVSGRKITMPLYMAMYI